MCVYSMDLCSCSKFYSTTILAMRHRYRVAEISRKVWLMMRHVRKGRLKWMMVFQSLSILQETQPHFTYVESLKFQMQPWDLWPFFTLEKTPTSRASIQRHQSTTTGIRNTIHTTHSIFWVSWFWFLFHWFHTSWPFPWIFTLNNKQAT